MCKTFSAVHTAFRCHELYHLRKIKKLLVIEFGCGGRGGSPPDDDDSDDDENDDCDTDDAEKTQKKNRAKTMQNDPERTKIGPEMLSHVLPKRRAGAWKRSW